MAVYTTDIPQPGDIPSQSQDQILQNFQSLADAQDRNHVSLTNVTLTDRGKHNFLQMPEQGSAPATAANEGGVYTKEASSITNLFWRQESNGTEVQMTNIAPTYDAGNFRGYTFLPGGLLIQYGFVNAVVTNTVVITFPVAFSADPYTVTANSNTISLNPIAITSIGTTSFTAGRLATTSIRIYWMAIGPKV